MSNWDSLSWWATGIFIAGLVLGAAVNEQFLFLLAGAYLLRPTLLALGLAKKYADERQRLIQFHSGNIALTVTVLSLIGFAIKARLEAQPPDNYYMLIALALLTKALVGLVMIGDYRAAGVRITTTIGILLFLFAALENGFSVGTLIEASPGILVLLVGLLGIKRPKLSAILLVMIGIALAIVFGPVRAFTLTRILVGLLLPLPVFIAAFCFFKASQAHLLTTTAAHIAGSI
jgi:hypothetical protein